MPTANITMRVDQELIDRIDQAAQHHGQTRTDYVLSWLPEYYHVAPSHTEPGQPTPTARRRDMRSRRLLASSQQG